MKPFVGHRGVKDNPYYSHCIMVTTVDKELQAVPCEDCPCFSNDSDWGVEDGCGLGYDIKSYAVELKEDGSEVSKYKYASLNCKLKTVIFDDGEFNKPEAITVFETTYCSEQK